MSPGKRRAPEAAASRGPSETTSTGQVPASISAAEHRIRVRRRAEAWQAGRALGELLGLADLLEATTSVDWLQERRSAEMQAPESRQHFDVWREFAWDMAERDRRGRLLLAVAS